MLDDTCTFCAHVQLGGVTIRARTTPNTVEQVPLLTEALLCNARRRPGTGRGDGGGGRGGGRGQSDRQFSAHDRATCQGPVLGAMLHCIPLEHTPFSHFRRETQMSSWRFGQKSLESRRVHVFAWSVEEVLGRGHTVLDTRETR